MSDYQSSLPSSNHLKNHYISSSSGRRKSSVARVHIKLGTGNVIINQQGLSKYFVNEMHRIAVLKPLVEVELENRLDIYVRVNGGGISGQSAAIQYGIVCALIKLEKSIQAQDERMTDSIKKGIGEALGDNDKIKRTLRAAHLVTQDSRIVERKKCGRRKARKRKQYSKR